jgi:hypothetical protein
MLFLAKKQIDELCLFLCCSSLNRDNLLGLAKKAVLVSIFCGERKLVL